MPLFNQSLNLLIQFIPRELDRGGVEAITMPAINHGSTSVQQVTFH
jgi:hypothetical protein